MNDIKNKFQNRIPIIPVLEKKSFQTIDLFYEIGVFDIFFDFQPDKLLGDLLKLFQKPDDNKNETGEASKNEETNKNTSQNYIINFYESQGTFIVELSGPLKKEKIAPLKLMFQKLLLSKLDQIRGVIYIFSNVNEDTMSFQNIWTLLRIWKSIGLKYDKINYLTTSKNIENNINKLFLDLGITHANNLIELIRKLYPELSNKDELEIFEFSSQILQAN